MDEGAQLPSLPRGPESSTGNGPVVRDHRVSTIVLAGTACSKPVSALARVPASKSVVVCTQADLIRDDLPA
jgi:hypothetical protein